MTNLLWKLVFQPRQLAGSMLIYWRVLFLAQATATIGAAAAAESERLWRPG